MQVGLLAGVYSRTGPDFERSLPLNLAPNVEETGISKGYLRSAPGIVAAGTGRGRDGGGIVWDGVLYRVSGTKLISVDEVGFSTTLGTVGGTGQASLAYSFDKLAAARNLNLYYWDGATFSQVTDIDLGDVLDVVWMDGYFVTTDGTSIVITELNDPTSVDPMKYGSSEADPDPVLGLLVVRGELVALNRNSIEFFRNAGTTGFPFQRNRGAQIPKGVVGTYAKCLFLDTFAFVGAGRNEDPRVYLAGAGQAVPISDRGIERKLAGLSDDELGEIILEARTGGGIQELLVHLPDETLVYCHSASERLELLVWYRLASGSDGSGAYRPRNFVLVYGGWHCGDKDSSALGLIDDTVASQFGEDAAWSVDASLVYTEGKGAVCHELELVGQFGRAAPGVEPRIFMSWTDDGLTFSDERSARAGYTGQRGHRIAWRRNGFIRQWRAFRFRGLGSTTFGLSRLEAQMEPLNA